MTRNGKNVFSTFQSLNISILSITNTHCVLHNMKTGKQTKSVKDADTKCLLLTGRKAISC